MKFIDFVIGFLFGTSAGVAFIVTMLSFALFFLDYDIYWIVFGLSLCFLGIVLSMLCKLNMDKCE